MSDSSQSEWRFYRDDMPELLPLLKALKNEAQP